LMGLMVLFEADGGWMDFEGEWKAHMIGGGQLRVRVRVLSFFD
jgi:hypothetical protein